MDMEKSRENMPKMPLVEIYNKLKELEIDNEKERQMKEIKDLTESRDYWMKSAMDWGESNMKQIDVLKNKDLLIESLESKIKYLEANIKYLLEIRR